MQTVDDDDTLSMKEAEDADDENLEDEDLEDEDLEDEDLEEDDIGARTIVMSDDDDDFSDADISMEVNVEKLVAQFEKAEATDIHRRAEIRRRLEELAEEGSLDDTYAIDFDD